jgi:hypothetical protein
MKIPERFYQNENLKFVFQDENGKLIFESDNLVMDAYAIHHDKSGEETYSFRPIDSGKYCFWCNSWDILKID